MWWDNIDYDLEAQGGKPVVKGNGIPVEVVLERLSVEPTMQSVLGAYPGLTEQDVKACLQYEIGRAHV